MEEEPGKISRQQNQGKSEKEDEGPSISTVQSHGAEGSSRCMVFTYFKGDSNSMVEQHFTRALKRVGGPIDVSSKRKVASIEPKSDEKPLAHPHHWDPHAPLWPSSPQGANLSAVPLRAPGASIRGPQYHIDSPSNLCPEPHQPWLLPRVSSHGREDSIFCQPMPDLHRMMPAAINSYHDNSFLASLRGESLPSENSQRHTAPKTNLNLAWTQPAPGPAEMRQSENVDVGLQAPQRRKDIYWY
ncbi:transcription cofactor vestigial-like protein 3 isoform X1 [Rhincodon typus]|uniref:transcription cofactor vestigial-like protein 3 isoform X1 n=2 Tax=Rhincodon typus TaxID=259920 RepID=UPI00202DDB11|nr:transcription cofactor vestigial-like protein 3 isoform X1 [Rhincodon typus]